MVKMSGETDVGKLERGNIRVRGKGGSRREGGTFLGVLVTGGYD